MFDSALHGSARQREDRYPQGGVAASRHALARHRYLEEKRSRLAVEAAERRRVASEQCIVCALTWLGRLWKAVDRLVRVATRRPVPAR
jgi:hypothetical protein